MQPIYFRTAVDETGHALGLQHHPRSPVLATTTQQPHDPEFPYAQPLHFTPFERAFLQHAPDPEVRPGGAPFRGGYSPVQPVLPPALEALDDWPSDAVV